MHGAPYPIEVSYTIFKKSSLKQEKSLSGRFVYEINTGTIPQLNSMGVPYGVYKTIGHNNMNNLSLDVILSFSEEPLEIIIKK